MSHAPAHARWSWPEPAAVAAAWLLLLALALGEEPLTFTGVLGQPLISVLAALLALWAAPGYVLWRWLVDGPARHAPAWALGLGLAWLLLPCAVAMAIGTSPSRLLAAVVVLNGALSAAFVAAWPRRRPRPPDPADRERAPSWWLVTAVALLVARLLDLATRRLNRLTYGGDEWVFMKAVRAFLEGTTVADRAEFDVWDLLVSLVVRLSRVEVFEAYRVHLPPLMVVAGALAFLVVAEAVLQERSLAWLALALQGLYALSDMHTRGEGLGMAWLVRAVEDRYVALLLALPLAQAAFLNALRGGGRRTLVAFAGLGVAATLLQPFAVPWLAFTCGVTYASALTTRVVPRSRAVLAAMAALLTLGLAVAWLLRTLRPSPYFVLYDPSWGFNATLLELSFRQLLILSLEKGWYIAHPWLLTHPMVLACLAGSLFLLPRFRQSLGAQWLLLGTWVPVVLVFNPATAVMIGHVVTPWRLYRLLWTMPVALVLAWVVGRALEASQARLAARWPAAARWRVAVGPLAVAALALVAAGLQPWMEEASRALRARNRVLVKPGEQAFLHEVASLAREREWRGTVLAPEGLSVRLPAWTTRLQPIPGLLAIRDRQEALLGACAAFYEAATLGPQEVALLHERGVRYVIAEAGSPVEAALRAQPTAFLPLHHGEELALYEWRPERWTGNGGP